MAVAFSAAERVRITNFFWTPVSDCSVHRV